MRIFSAVAAGALLAGCGGRGPSPAMQPALSAPTPPAVTVQTGSGYIAHVHRPAAEGARPAVLLIGGSGGGIGWQDYIGERLAQRGFVAMAVAYFAMDSLPRELDRIPLEAFDRAIDWLRTQPDVDAQRLGIGGVSKGGEAALLVASAHPEVRAVAVFVPSGIVFQSVTRDFRATSSWTRGGVEVPYVAYGTAPTGSPLVAFYRAGLREASSSTLAAATIPVERIGGPLLMLSGADDTLWGSGDLANAIAARLIDKRFPHAVENIVYPNAGHLISSIRTDGVTSRGGTDEGNTFAQTDGQRRFLDFFSRTLAVPSRR